MKYIIANDIHGSLYYTKVLCEAITAHQADQIILLGDLLYHGPRNDLPRDYNPKEVIGLLNHWKDKIIAIRGNCDSEVDQMVLAFDCMSDYIIIQQQDYKIFLTHGHIYNPENMPKLHTGDIFLFGHIHIPVMKQQDGVYILNAGSISLPKQDSHHAYAILENKNYQIYDENHTLLHTYSMQ